MKLISGQKNSSYFILHLFSKHFPLEFIIWKKMEEEFKTDGKRNLRLVKFIQELISKKSELSEKQNETMLKLIKIIRNPTKFLVVEQNNKKKKNHSF